MAHETVLKELNDRFVYTRDPAQFGRREHWYIMKNPTGLLKGDCEDYSLTLLWLIQDKSMWKFWWSLVTRKAQIWFCYLDGEGHAVLKYKNKWIDNNLRHWVDKFPPKYEMKYRYALPIILWKLRWHLLLKGNKDVS